jgi:preprotein translocase subunit SecE
MTTEDDINSDDPKAALATDEPAEPQGDAALGALALADQVGPAELSSGQEDGDGDEEEDDDAVGTPAQLGFQRFVYAAYFAGGIAVAFMLSKAISYGWTRLSLWKPTIGEPHDEVVMPVAGLIGALVAFYYYRDEKTRTLAEEVASELGKVSWPTRDEVVNGTFVVVVTTFIATVFFALMDRFWGFVTNLVYGA